MFGKIVTLLSVLALASAQIPSLGFCPEYVPMANFDMNRFLGVWYEAERYFQLSEVVSRCVMANYTKGQDGKLRVSNEVTNRFTGIKRILEGEIKPAASKSEEGKLHVKYTTIPLTPETKYSVLETDYDTYAVMWSCSGIGPVHTQNAWVMTRERLPPGEVLQKAYGVLDKYKISKTFFVKTDQEDCAYLAANPSTPEENAEKPGESQSEEASGNQRSAITPDAPEVVVQTRKTESAVPLKETLVPETPVLVPVETVPEPAKVAEIPQEIKSAAAAAPVPELILKTADKVNKAEEKAPQVLEAPAKTA
ncbi:apolipoprotein D-like [Prorops nasuta]|uniref:apolipoprotein D-like n=1 Tax=Prorops nasuta TaxID=863751 RepID=UPI0034CDFBB4